MSLRVLVGWAVGILGLLVVLAAFGLNFGIRAPLDFVPALIVGILLIVVGVAVASGRSAITG